MLPALPLTCAVIDDNEMNRLTLEHLVELTESLTLVASLADGVQALNFLRTHPPVDLLLLDIEMPHLSGLDLVRALPQPAPAIVLVTSHRDFAVEAFALHVADYLVKPVDFARFHQAVARVVARRSPPPEATAVLPAPGSPDQHLFVKVNNKLVRLNFGDVLFIEAMSTYSVLVTAAQKHIVYATLKALEERLPFAHFQRVHRSYIVNTQRIEAVEDNTLRLGPYEVPVGKSYQEEFYRSLRNL
ncbi:LytR/AlgR family response regulator transcription factor [Hymenobacter caeli]|uniref:DNA-binding LytR/AlgR family response regulator n=1 Tax=Hymenobacter caeli TaxID=2735894 RepID=A0ABX2FJJ9_9BACT|nr:LytTR family DNA-binding domain-containing protein [Hymenobacter caeli]NRT17295.1 DNA-binding LytR/AlgR family response regulator [Hymenobacter caeli]